MTTDKSLREEIERLTRERQEWWEAANDFDDEGNETLWKDIADAEHAKVERLTRERDTILKEVAEWRSRPDALRADKAEARAEAAERQVATLREALSDTVAWMEAHGDDGNEPFLFAEKIRSARCALAETEKKDG